MDPTIRTFTKTYVLYTYETSTTNDCDKVCNIECVHCYYRFEKQKWKPLVKMKEEVEKAISLGSDHIQLTGAEPTLHPDYLNLIQYIHSKSILCSVITNGHLLSNYDFAEKTKPYIEYYLFSVHGATKETVNKITQNPNSWDLIKTALINLEKLNIEIQINYTVMRINFQEIPLIENQVMKYSNITRFNFINFNPFNSWQTEEGEKEVKNFVASYDESMPFLETISEKLQSENIDVALRYFPFCKVPEWLWPKVFNFVTSRYDRNEWRWEWMFPKQFEKNKSILETIGDKLKFEGSKEEKLEHVFGKYYKGFRQFFDNHESCKKCSHIYICDQPHNEQVKLFPKQTFETIRGDKIKTVKRHNQDKNELQPFISIIIPTYNDKETLELSIKSGLLQDYPKDKYEIIIVDDGSSDKTKETVLEISKVSKVPIRYYFQENRGYRVGHARNLGAEHAKGEILVFWNQDIIAFPDLINNFINSIKSNDVIQGYTAGYTILEKDAYKQKNVIPEIKEILETKQTHKFRNLKLSKDIRDESFNNSQYNNSESIEDPWRLFFGTCFAIKREIFEKNQFDNIFTGWGIEDAELGYRLIKNNYTLKFEKKCICLHLPHNVSVFNETKINEWTTNMLRFYNKYPNTSVENHLVNDLFPHLKQYSNYETRLNKFKEELEIVKNENFLASKTPKVNDFLDEKQNNHSGIKSSNEIRNQESSYRNKLLHMLDDETYNFIESNTKHIYGPKSIATKNDEVILICLVKNGKYFIQKFIEYYQSKKFKHIIFIDNGSTDDSVNLIKKYNNISIYQCILNHRKYQVPLRQYFIKKFTTNKWSLTVDIDEFFDWPHSEILSLKEFISYLNKNEYNSISCNLLDMFPENSIKKDQEVNFEECQYFSTDNIIITNYERSHFNISIKELENNINNNKIKLYYGGVTGKILKIDDLILTKHPLLFYNTINEPFVMLHLIKKSNIADVSGVLYHYKHVGKFYEKIKRVVKEKSHHKDSMHYKIYQNMFNENGFIKFYDSNSKRIKNTQQLIDNSFIVVSDEFLNYCKFLH